MTLQLTDKSFDVDVLKSQKPVIVDFWAEWCGPCKMLAPIIDEVASELGDKVTMAKMNVDDNETPGNYGVRSIPTLVMFKDGAVIANHVGVISKSALIEWIDSYIS